MAELQSLLDQLPVYASIVSPEHRYVAISGPMQSFFGRPRQEVIGRHIRDIHGDDGYEEIRPHLLAAERGACGRFERRTQGGDGRLHWLDVHYSPLRDEHGTIGGTIAVITDVTSRRRAEEALRGSEARARSLFETASIGIALVGQDGRVLLANDADCQFLGYPREELVGMHFSQFTHPEDLTIDEALYTGLIEGRHQSYTIDKRYIRKDGTVVWGRLGVSLMRAADGTADYSVVTCQDITERRRAEDALHASEQRFRALVQESVDIFSIFDAEGRLEFISPSIERLVGLPVPQALGRHMFDFVHPDDVPVTREFLDQMRQDPGTTARCVVRHPHVDGGWRLFQCVGRNLLHVPGIRGFVVSSRDITEQQRLQDQLHEAQKLESVGRLAGGLAHDFNNLLTVVLGYAELLGATIPDDAVEGEYLREIRQAGERARDLTQQLLAFARRQVIAPRPIRLNDVVGASERLLSRLLGEDLQIECRLAPDLWPIEADPAQLHQVLMNLALNARDAMPAGGAFTLTTSNVVVSGDEAAGHDVPPGDYAVLAAADTGPGIPADVLPHLFEPFFTTKRPGHGTGLGLATVWGTVTQAGGHVRVASDAGQGTTFRLYFPRVSRPPEADATAAHPPGKGGSEAVLVVEDEPAVRELVARTLRDAGYEVEATGDPHAAVAAVAGRGRPPALLVTDVVMPGMSGKALADRLACACPTLKVLYISGYAESTLVHHGVPDRGVALLTKPFGPADLLARVRSILDAG